MRAIIAITIALCTTGCGHAVMVQNPYSYSGYSPANRTGELGVVSYKTRGSHADVDSGRFSAYKLMAQACRGRGYVIVDYPHKWSNRFKEGDPFKEEGFYRVPLSGWPQAIRDRSNNIPPTPIYIAFQCIAH